MWATARDGRDRPLSLPMPCDSTMVRGRNRGAPSSKVGGDGWLGPEPLEAMDEADEEGYRRREEMK